MSEFEVTWDSLVRVGDTLAEMKSTINQCRNHVETVKTGLSALSGLGNLSGALDAIINNVNKQTKNINTLGESLKAIALLYRLTDQKISGTALNFKNDNGDGTGGTGGRGGTSFDAPGSSVDWGDALRVLLSSFGIVGQYASMIKDMLSLKFDKAVTGGMNLFSELLDNAYADDPKDMKSLLFGLGVDGVVKKGLAMIAAGDSKGEAIKTVWKEVAGKYKFGNNVVKNIGAGVQWATSIIDNAFDNYEEFGTIANGRFWGETAVETGVDVGTAILATGAVTTAAVALGISAPAVAVAAVAGLAVWGVNSAVEHFTGKDVGEWVADAVCDGVEWVADKVGKGISSAKDAVCGWLGI